MAREEIATKISWYEVHPFLDPDYLYLEISWSCKVEKLTEYNVARSMCAMRQLVCGTCVGQVKMGKPGEPDTCVDKDFQVAGLQGLRVVDMSVAPFLPR